MARFRDRADAGRRLAARLREYAARPDVLVLALPRGGVPVGFEVARALDVPLDAFVVRKLGVPGYRELAMGAIATGAVRVLKPEVVAGLGIRREAVEAVTVEEEAELRRREQPIGASARRRRSGGARSSWWTMAWRPARPCEWPPRRSGDSHYFDARLAEQFDAVLHFDETRAVEPLERTAGWEVGELPETYPHAV